jgi:hypothetical protein
LRLAVSREEAKTLPMPKTLLTMVCAPKRLQAEIAAELEALLPALLDRAFKGRIVKTKDVLHLNLHRKFFAQIAGGTKRIEYRSTPYWRRRLEVVITT